MPARCHRRPDPANERPWRGSSCGVMVADFPSVPVVGPCLPRPYSCSAASQSSFSAVARISASVTPGAKKDMAGIILANPGSFAAPRGVAEDLLDVRSREDCFQLVATFQ
jgi:hypothetical protein